MMIMCDFCIFAATHIDSFEIVAVKIVSFDQLELIAMNFVDFFFWMIPFHVASVLCIRRSNQ